MASEANTQEKPKGSSKKDLVSETYINPRTGEVVDAGAGGMLETDYNAYAADAGAGFENQTSADISIPFMVILQPGSPAVLVEDSPAKAGMIINTTTNELIRGTDGIPFIPAMTEHVFVEWVPRTKGGGLVATHAVDSPLVTQQRQAGVGIGDYKAGENDLVETFYVYGVSYDSNGNAFPATLAFSSTHIKPYRDWMFKARQLTIKLPSGATANLPLFAHAYRMRTVRREENNNTWYVPVFEFDVDNDATKSRLAPGSELYAMAKSVKEAITSGAMKASTEGLSRAGRSNDDGTGGAVKGSKPANPGDAPY